MFKFSTKFQRYFVKQPNCFNATLQWSSRTFGCWLSNLPAFRLRFWKLESCLKHNAWFPAFRCRSSVAVSPLSVAKVRKNYVHLLEFRKNSIVYVKITFPVSVSSPLPLIRSYRIEFYFSVPTVSYVARTPGAPPTLLRRKLARLPPEPAALLPRTRPSNGIRNGRYGHGFYGNGYGNGHENEYGNGNVMLETRCKSRVMSTVAIVS